MRSEEAVREKIAFFEKKPTRDVTVALLRDSALRWLRWVLNDKKDE